MENTSIQLKRKLAIFPLLMTSFFMHAQVKDIGSVLSQWNSYLKGKGYKRTTIPNDCDCYTVEDFCKDHPKGTYILGTGTHALCIKDGNYYDVWDSGNETPIYYFMKDEE